MIGGAVGKLNGTGNSKVINGFKSLLSSFAGKDSVKSAINTTENDIFGGLKQVDEYTLCYDLPLLNTTATVKLFVTDKSVFEVRVQLLNVDYGLFVNNVANQTLVNVTIGLQATYHPTPFVRSNRQQGDMFVPLHMFCPFPTTSSMPTISKNLHLLLEESSESDKMVVVREERINFDQKYVRRTFTIPTPDSKKEIYQKFDGWMLQYGKDFSAAVNQTVHVVHDYNSGVEWAVVPSKFSCSMRAIPVESPEANVNGSIVNLKSDLLQVLGFNSSGSTNFSYFGFHLYGGVNSLVFGANKTDYPKPGQYSVVKLFFNSDCTCDTDMTSATHFMGAHVYSFNSKTGAKSGNYRLNVIPMEAQLGNSYWLGDDFKYCAARTEANSSYSFNMNDTVGLCTRLADKSISQLYFEQEVSNQVAVAAKVSALRIGDLIAVCRQGVNGSILIDVNFRIIEKLNTTMKGNVVNAPVLLNISQAFSNLNSSVNSGSFNVTIKSSNDSYTVSAVNSTLRPTNGSLVINGTVTVVNQEIFNGHTAGAMAGLAFAMLIIGALLAMFGVYLYQRRRNAQFSYMVQE